MWFVSWLWWWHSSAVWTGTVLAAAVLIELVRLIIICGYVKKTSRIGFVEWSVDWELLFFSE